jgi:hypothetical protein
VKPKLGVFVQPRPHQLRHRHIQSSKRLRKTRLLTGIPRPHRSRVVRPCRDSACRTPRLRSPCRLQPPRLHHNSILPRRLRVVQRIRRPPPRPRQFTRCVHRPKHLSLSIARNPQPNTNLSSGCSQLLYRVYRTLVAIILRTHLVLRIKSVSRNWWASGRRLQRSIRLRA